MYIAVYPGAPSSALVAAVIAAGYQPVPVEDFDEIESREPPDGWAAAVIEAADDLGRAVSLADKVTNEASMPVLLVADRTLTEALGSESGFTDFILTPIDKTELKARLGRLTPAGGEEAADILEFGDLELNTATYQATIDGEPTDLTYMEYELLRFFLEHPGRVWSRDQILSRVWGYDYFGGSRTVDVHVRRLRAKLGEERASWISTVRSVGYRFG